MAQLAKSLGIEVSGCDAGVYPPMSDQLEQAGIHLIEGYDPEQLDDGADLYVIGNAISRGNPLLEEILNRGLPYTSGPQWLQENILNGRHVLAVAGTHGKTTTSLDFGRLRIESEFSDRRCSSEFRTFGSPDRVGVFRDRSR